MMAQSSSASNKNRLLLLGSPLAQYVKVDVSPTAHVKLSLVS